MFATVTIAVVSFGGRRRHLALLRVAVLAADERCARRLELLGAQRRLLVRARRDEAGEQEEDAEGRRLAVKRVGSPSSLARRRGPAGRGLLRGSPRPSSTGSGACLSQIRMLMRTVVILHTLPMTVNEVAETAARQRKAK